MDASFNDYYRRLMESIMQQQMGNAESISNAVPRRDPLLDIYYSIPQMPSSYRPPEYYNYGKPVRVG